MKKLELLAHIFNEEITEDIGLIPLTKGHYAIVDKEDEERVNKYSWCSGIWKARFGERVCGRRTTYENKEQHTELLHRFLMEAEEDIHIDHINGEASDNRKCNLRKATNAENIRNMKHSHNKNGYKGVMKYETKSGVRYAAQIRLDDRTKHISTHQTPEEAARAYNEIALKEWGEYACLNEVTP